MQVMNGYSINARAMGGQGIKSREGSSVAMKLRPVVYLYAAINIAVAALLLSTVSATVPVGPSQEVARLR
jgi:hypothetical protein